MNSLTFHNIWWRTRWGWQFLKRNQFPKFKAPFWFQTEMGMFKCPDIYGPMLFEKGWEAQTVALVAGIRNGLFVDVGANLGFYTVLAANNGNRVMAVEANPVVYSCLKETIRVNQLENLVTVINAAAWSSNGPIEFESVGDTSLSHVSGYPTVGGRKSISTNKVLGITLDRVINERPSLVKLDIEHAEAEALKGATKLLQWKTPIIFEAITEAELKECEALIGTKAIWLGKEGAGVNYYAA